VETSDVTSAVVGSHLPESLSGPCRWLRYSELKTYMSGTFGVAGLGESRRLAGTTQVILKI